jgi:hypothetical protein
MKVFFVEEFGNAILIIEGELESFGSHIITLF